MADQDTPNGRAERRARIIAGQALREASSKPTGRWGRRRRNHGPIWTTPAPIVVAQPEEANGTGDGTTAGSSELGDNDKTTPLAALSRGTSAKKHRRS